MQSPKVIKSPLLVKVSSYHNIPI